jgi:hypothetical protein
MLGKPVMAVKALKNKCWHGDTHDVWINPLNPENFIIGDDGGGEVTFNGETFTELDTPTSQFYHVSVDNEFRIIFMGLNRTILPFVSLLDLVAIA